MAAIAVKLGDQTMGASDRLADFSALLANRSIPRLDNFGISSGKVRERVEELKREGYDLDQAFKLAVLEEGRKSLEKLGDTSDSTAVRIDQLEAAFKDARTGMADFAAMVAAEAFTGGNTAEFTHRLSNLGETMKQTFVIGKYATVWYKNFMQGGFDAEKATKAAQEAVRGLGEEWTGVAPAAEDATDSLEDAVVVLEDQERQFGATDAATLAYLDALNETTDGVEAFMNSSNGIPELLQEQREQTLKTQEAFLDLAMQYTDYQADATDTADDFAQQREQIEEEHQQRLAEIKGKGQSWRQKIDVQETQLELRIAQGRLNELLAKQAEFNEETTDLERARTEKAILNLQEEVAEKTSILQRAQNGYLVMKGQNVDDLLAEEQRQYDESIAELEASQAEKEEAQRQSLGRMVLSHFNAWAEMNLATDGYTQEEIQFIQNMRLSLSQQYGLITDAAVEELDEQQKSFDQLWSIAEQGALKTVEAMNRVTESINAIPSSKTVQISYNVSGDRRPGDPAIQMQLGGPVMASQAYIVGEVGPELFVPWDSGTIVPNHRLRDLGQQRRELAWGQTAQRAANHRLRDLGQQRREAGGLGPMPIGIPGPVGGGRCVDVYIINNFESGSVRDDDDIYRISREQERILELKAAPIWECH
jgi:hypothetical protein